MRPARLDTLVLCYHAVSEDWPSALAVSPRAFEHQMRFLLRRGYRPATFQAAVAGTDGKTVAVTFDDGYSSVATSAAPILDRLGIPATVFVTTNFVGRDGPMTWPGISHWVGTPHEHELESASWGQLEDLVRRGWEIGSHTRSHPRLTDLDDAAIAAELTDSKRACESNLGIECRSLAYPYGAHDDRVAQAARAAGYSAAGLLASRISREEALRWPRVGVYRRDGSGVFALKASRRVRSLRSSRAWPPLAASVRRLRKRTQAQAPS